MSQFIELKSNGRMLAIRVGHIKKVQQRKLREGTLYTEVSLKDGSELDVDGEFNEIMNKIRQVMEGE